MARKKTTKRSPARASGGSAHDHNAFIMILGGGFVVVLLILYFMGRQGSFFPSFGQKDMMYKDDAMMSDVMVTEHAVSIENYTFSEAEVRVKVGDTVTWTNNDSEVHTATADDGSFDTGLIETGQTGSVTFDAPGTYTYHCMTHPNMIGTVIVEE